MGTPWTLFQSNCIRRDSAFICWNGGSCCVGGHGVSATACSGSVALMDRSGSHPTFPDFCSVVVLFPPGTPDRRRRSTRDAVSIASRAFDLCGPGPSGKKSGVGGIGAGTVPATVTRAGGNSPCFHALGEGGRCRPVDLPSCPSPITNPFRSGQANEPLERGIPPERREIRILPCQLLAPGIYAYRLLEETECLARVVRE